MLDKGDGREFADLDSTELITRAKGGEQESAEELFRRYRPRLLRIARQTLGPKLHGLEPSDIVQSTLRRAASAWKHFEPEHGRAVSAWFVTIMNNTVLDHRRREQAIKRGGGVQPMELKESELGSECPEPTLLDQLAEDDLAARVWSSLAAAEHELVCLRLADDLSWDEIAGRLGMGNGELARKRYGAILGRLRAMLSPVDS